MIDWYRITGSEPAGVDRPGDGAEEAEALLQVPDAGTGERVSVQRLRVQAEALGAGAQPQPDRTPSQNLVPEPAHEEQEEQPAAAGRQRRQRTQRSPRQPGRRLGARPQPQPTQHLFR